MKDEMCESNNRNIFVLSFTLKTIFFQFQSKQKLFTLEYCQNLPFLVVLSEPCGRSIIQMFFIVFAQHTSGTKASVLNIFFLTFIILYLCDFTLSCTMNIFEKKNTIV